MTQSQTEAALKSLRPDGKYHLVAGVEVARLSPDLFVVKGLGASILSNAATQVRVRTKEKTA